jgi:hypothetical protein
MQVPAIVERNSLIRLTQGAIVGALATVVIGFNWGGWMRESTAEKIAADRTTAALVQAYVPVCVERFEHQQGVEAKWAELMNISSWQRDTYIEKSGFATPEGATTPNNGVASACANALTKIIEARALTPVK